jgi:exonuclease SbcC
MLATLSEALDIHITTETNVETIARAAEAAEQVDTALTTAVEAGRMLTRAVEQADRRRVAASDSRRALERDTAATQKERRAATAALQTARDTVSVLGPPAVDSSDIAGGWAALSIWGEDQHNRWSAALPALSDAAGEARETAVQAKSKHTACTTELKRLRTLEQDALQNLAHSRHQWEDVSTQQKKLQAALASQPDAPTVAELLTQLEMLEQVAVETRIQLEAARRRRNSAEAAFATVNAVINGGRDKLAAARDPLTRYGAPVLSTVSLAVAWRELSDWAAGTAEGLTCAIGKAKKAAELSEAAYSAAAAALVAKLTANALPAPAADKPLTTLRSTVATTVAGAAASAKSDAVHAADRLAQREDLESRRSEADEQAQVAGLLAQLLRSDGFRAWLLESALASLVDDASAILFEMSSGQFELRTNGKDLEVIDHNDADSTRPVRTLSGGETFQASLALALALSRQIATLAASGSAKLESIFLDEGFGSLDETNLEVVAEALETLASSGERMVGVITHVASLAERIPVQFQVTRTGATSTISRVGI